MFHLGCDIGGAKEPGVIYFPTNWGAKEPQNPHNHRVVIIVLGSFSGDLIFSIFFHCYFKAFNVGCHSIRSQQHLTIRGARGASPRREAMDPGDHLEAQELAKHFPEETKFFGGQTKTGWWFQRFFISTPIWGRFPF